MKESILKRIKALGGNIDAVKGMSLKDDILSITFDTVLYQKRCDTPWATAEEEEPIYGISAFVDANIDLYKTNKDAFYGTLFNKYYRITDEGFGQVFWQVDLFTPFEKGTADFKEWNSMFEDEEMTDLSLITSFTNETRPTLIQLFYSYGYPDHIYISPNDPHPDNPTLFGTDHEQFFNEIFNMGTLEDYVQNCMTKEELLEIVNKRLA